MVLICSEVVAVEEIIDFLAQGIKTRALACIPTLDSPLLRTILMSSGYGNEINIRSLSTMLEKDVGNLSFVLQEKGVVALQN